MALTRGNSTKADLYAEIKLLKLANKESIRLAKESLRKEYTKRAAGWNKHKNKRIHTEKRKGNRAFDGVFAHTTIMRYCVSIGISHHLFCYITIMNLIPRMEAKDAVLYGLAKQSYGRWALNRMCTNGYAEMFRHEGKNYYYASMKSKKIFDDYKEYHAKILKAVEEYDEYKQHRAAWKRKPVK